MEPSLLYKSHKEIDKEKWNGLIAQSPNGLAYAHTNMLDAMSPGWDALVMGDYDAAMPLTWRSKLGIRYLCQPAFCQQLGVFSKGALTAKISEAFLRRVAISFRLAEIYLHAGTMADPALISCNNFMLDLNRPYEAIRAQYKNDLLKNLTRSRRYHMTYTVHEDVCEGIELYKEYYGNRLGYRPQDYEAFAQVCVAWQKEGRCFARAVHLEERNLKELLAFGVFLKDDNRIYNIASTTLPNGRTLEANHFLFDHLIREFSNQRLWLDFEGSDLPGVAKFYLKFDPVNQPYFFWKSNRLPMVLKWWKR
jgi:hypothetical protein